MAANLIFNNLTRSSQQNVIIGDLGSSPTPESFYTINIRGRGTEEGLRQMAKSKIGSGTVVSEGIKTLDNGLLEYEARVRTTNGI